MANAVKKTSCFQGLKNQFADHPGKSTLVPVRKRLDGFLETGEHHSRPKTAGKDMISEEIAAYGAGTLKENHAGSCRRG